MLLYSSWYAVGYGSSKMVQSTCSFSVWRITGCVITQTMIFRLWRWYNSTQRLKFLLGWGQWKHPKSYQLWQLLLVRSSYFLVATVQHSAVGDRHEVTLPCENVIDGSTIWISGVQKTLHPQSWWRLEEKLKLNLNRANVIANGSLVIKNITYQNVGHHVCRQLNKWGNTWGGPGAALDVILSGPKWLFLHNVGHSSTKHNKMSYFLQISLLVL